MQSVLLIDDVARADVLMRPGRVDLLLRLAEPRSCADVAEDMGSTPQRVYYHVKALEGANLVDKVSETQVRGFREASYQAVARSYWLSPRLVQLSGGARATRDRLSRNYLLNLAEEFHIEVGRLGAHREETPTVGHSGVTSSAIYGVRRQPRGVDGAGSHTSRETSANVRPNRSDLLFRDASAGTPIRVLIVDDHHMVREGLICILKQYADLTVVGEASTGKQALQLIDTLMPEVIIMDMQMPGWDGAESTRRILQKYPATVVLGVSIQTDPHVAKSMLDAGAAAFLPKETAGNHLYAAIQAAVQRRTSSRSFMPPHPI